MTGKRTRVARLIVAIAFAVPAFLGSLATSAAAPTKQQVEAAKVKLASLQHQLEIVIERFDTTRAKLQEVQGRLADARATRNESKAEADAARALLSDRAVAAYTGAGSQLDVLLAADTFADFSDRLQFVGAVVQSDADLAAEADAAGEKAAWAADQFSAVVGEQESLLADLVAQKGEITARIDDQRSLYEKLNKDYEGWLVAQRVAEKAAQETITDPGSTTGGGGSGGFVPPPNASAAQVAIAAAKTQIGVTYIWGSASPGVGFDCSGLTSWAWGQAGVSLPHSSAMQAAVTPDVSRDQLQPGDLLFFYSPISHVSMYLGGGMMIDASHPGPGGEVEIRSVYWDNFVIGGRPG